ncbi:MAG TPA: OmpA family protein [Polyangiaceae bacterium]|nr:OmpA family protein [Polyangiaceae bacterium]
MVESLCPCPLCARHIRVSENYCHFCGVGVRFASAAALRGRLSHLRREVQIAFGASLLGVATASCVPDPRGASAATPEGAESMSKRAGGARKRAESTPDPADASANRASVMNGDAEPAPAVVAIYGGSSVAIYETVEYARDSLVIDAEGERTLVALKEVLGAFDCDIAIQGHAGRDEAKAAEWLSKRRAELVRQRLIALGADGKRLDVEAFGASRPRTTSHGAPARDRRVSFFFHANVNGHRRGCDESDRRAQ